MLIIFAFVLAGIVTLQISAFIDAQRIAKKSNKIINQEIKKILELNKINVVQEYLKEEILCQFISPKILEQYNKAKDYDTLNEETQKEISNGFVKYEEIVIAQTVHETYLNIYHKIYKFNFSTAFELGFRAGIYHLFCNWDDFIDLDNLNYMYSKVEE